MVVVHRVFRREIHLLPVQVEAVPDGEGPRFDLVAAHAAELFSALHHHHTAEDEPLRPRLRQRAPLYDDLAERMVRQHATVSELLGTVERLFPEWQRPRDSSRRTELVNALRQLSSALDEHLAEEEQHILPLAAEHLTAEEWDAIGERSMAANPKNRMLVMLGYILEETDPEERRQILAHIPLPGRIAYRLIGQRRYQQEVTSLRQGVTIPVQGRI